MFVTVTWFAVCSGVMSLYTLPYVGELVNHSLNFSRSALIYCINSSFNTMTTNLIITLRCPLFFFAKDHFHCMRGMLAPESPYAHPSYLKREIYMYIKFLNGMLLYPLQRKNIGITHLSLDLESAMPLKWFD